MTVVERKIGWLLSPADVAARVPESRREVVDEIGEQLGLQPPASSQPRTSASSLSCSGQSPVPLSDVG